MNEIKLNTLEYSVGNWRLIQNFSYQFVNPGIFGILAPVEDQVSYLLKIIGGIIEPDSGTVTINATDIHHGSENEIKEIRKSLSFVFARGGILSNLSIIENLLLPLDFHFPEQSRDVKVELIKEFFARFTISEKFLTERPAGLHPQMAKMLLLIRAFLLKPKIILYDNPLSDLELRYKKLVLLYMLELQKQQEVTQLFVSTSDSLFEIADYNLVFSNGNLIQEGSWDELIISGGPETTKIIREYLEVGINET